MKQMKNAALLRMGAMFAFSAIAILSAPPALALSALEPWDAAARDALATPVKVWLGLMMLTNLSTIAFLKNHIAARFVFAGFLVSHGIVMVLWNQGAEVLAGQVSLFHVICWTPGAIALLLRRREIRYPSAYGIWATLSLIFFFGSMLIDVRDATIFLGHVMGT